MFLYAVGKGGPDVFPWCHVEVRGERVVIAYEGDFGVVDVVTIYYVEGEGIGREDIIDHLYEYINWDKRFTREYEEGKKNFKPF